MRWRGNIVVFQESSAVVPEKRVSMNEEYLLFRHSGLDPESALSPTSGSRLEPVPDSDPRGRDDNNLTFFNNRLEFSGMRRFLLEPAERIQDKGYDRHLDTGRDEPTHIQHGHGAPDLPLHRIRRTHHQDQVVSLRLAVIDLRHQLGLSEPGRSH